jgi:NCS1 family nucleobase:cation symporter-1
MGIIAASCTGRIWGTAIWNPAGILDAILAENNDPKTKFAVFLGTSISPSFYNLI